MMFQEIAPGFHRAVSDDGQREITVRLNGDQFPKWRESWVWSARAGARTATGAEFLLTDAKLAAVQELARMLRQRGEA